MMVWCIFDSREIILEYTRSGLDHPKVTDASGSNLVQKTKFVLFYACSSTVYFIKLYWGVEIIIIGCFDQGICYAFVFFFVLARPHAYL